MSDIAQIENSKDIQRTPSIQGLRWRIVPGTLLAIFAVIGLIGVAIEVFTIAYFMHKVWLDSVRSR